MAGRERRDKGEDPFVFLRHLAKGRIPFVIVGGAALALHGIPRSTLDIDVVVPASALPGLFSAAARPGPLRLCVAGLGDIERMKRKSGRPIDLADIALIREKRAAAKGRP